MYHCPNCGHSLAGLTKALRDLQLADQRRRAISAEYRRTRYQTDPEYRERHLARMRRYRQRIAATAGGSSTPSGAADRAPDKAA